MPIETSIKSITRKEWIAALRSGKFKQAKRLLFKRSTGGMCCLGVACHLAGVKFNDLYEFDFQTTSFNVVDAEKLLTSLNISQQDCDNLADMNDAGKRFKTIANVIEKLPLASEDPSNG